MNVIKQESEIRLSPHRTTIHCFRRHIGKSRDQAQTALDNAEFAARYVVLSDENNLDLVIRTVTEQLERLL